jgi:iron-sulfur cluster assembly accessory protein
MALQAFVITVTEAAAARVRQVIREHGLPDGAGLRVAAVGGGCSGLNYDVRVVPGGEPGDEPIDTVGVRLWVDPASAPALNGMTVDWLSTMTESRFTFENPNARGTCGCGVSFNV